MPYSPATREVERVLCQILEEYLGLDRVGIDDNYAELGATSLDMVQLSGQMARHYPQVSVVSLYNHATVRQLATFCQPPEGESNAPSPQPAVQANQIAKRALQIAKNTARSHTSLH